MLDRDCFLEECLSALLLTALSIVTGTSCAEALDWNLTGAPEIDSNAVLRGYGGENETPVFRLELPAAGVATVDLATAPDRAAEKLEHRQAPGATILEQSATHLALAVREPGVFFLRVSAEDPGEPLGRYKLTTGFVAARVLEETFSLASGLRVSRTSFHAFEPATKGDPEPVDPDPDGLTAAGGRLLASLVELHPALAPKGDPEPVDPDPDGLTFRGYASGGDPPRVLFYQPTCGPVRNGEIDDHGDTLSCATPLDLARRVAGRIGNGRGDDADVFVVTLSELATVEIATTGDADTFGELLDRAGQRLAQDDDGAQDGGARNFRIVRTLAPGRYYVRVEGAGGASGAYELAVTARDW